MRKSKGEVRDRASKKLMFSLGRTGFNYFYFVMYSFPF